MRSMSREDLVAVGVKICQRRDWHWVAIWCYNIHRLFRSRMKVRDVWKQLDSLIREECDWHLAKDLFSQIRQINLTEEKNPGEDGERAYLLLGEITAKSMSNASWRPGLFDYNAPWQIPA